MRMARVNVYLPDDLAQRVKAAGLNVSKLTQEAVRGALDALRTDDWLDDLSQLHPTGVSHDDVRAAVDDAKDEFEHDRA